MTAFRFTGLKMLFASIYKLTRLDPKRFKSFEGAENYRFLFSVHSSKELVRLCVRLCCTAYIIDID